jgi:hypothetical protein
MFWKLRQRVHSESPRRFTTVLVVLAAIGVLMRVSEPSASGSQPPPVTPVLVTNTPLPVALNGPGIISGTVSATQSGAWNVGVTGTPNVNIANQPGAPVLTRATDNPGLTPFQKWSNEQGTGVGGSQGVLSFYVSNDSRLVIEHVNATCYVPDPTAVAQLGGFRLDVQGGGFAEYELPVQRSVTGQIVVDLPLKAYADPGTQVFFHISGQFPSGSMCAGALSGYLVSMP